MLLLPSELVEEQAEERESLFESIFMSTTLFRSSLASTLVHSWVHVRSIDAYTYKASMMLILARVNEPREGGGGVKGKAMSIRIAGKRRYRIGFDFRRRLNLNLNSIWPVASAIFKGAKCCRTIVKVFDQRTLFNILSRVVSRRKREKKKRKR